MGVAVVDLMPGSPGVREVVRQWVTCGLAIPVAWARPQESPDWLLLDRIDERSTQSLDPSLGVLNRLGARSELRVVVLISSLASTVETEPTVDESEVVAQPLPASATVLQTIQSIYDDINRNFGPGEVPFILVVIPPSRDRTGPLATGEDMHSTLTRTIPWRDIFVVAPEDSPDPSLGNEVSTISDPAVAHALLSASSAWATTTRQLWNAQFHEGEAGLQGARLVRVWTRVVDVGFLIDHVTRGLGTKREFESTRIDAPLGQLLVEPGIRADLMLPDQPPGPTQLNGWRYVLGYLRYALPRLPRTLLTLVIDRVLAPIRQFFRWLLALILRLIGAPPARPPAGLGSAVRTAPPTAVERAKETIDALNRGAEVEEAPSANEALWRELTSRVIEFVDSGELSIEAVTGPTGDDSEKHLLSRLSDKYRDQAGVLREAVLRQIELIESSGGDDPSQPDVGLDDLQRRRSRRRRLIVRILIVLTVVSFAFGLVIPGFAFLAVAAGVVMIGALLALLVKALAVLARRFRDEVSDLGGLKRENAWLDTLTRALITRTYRVDEIAIWTRILRAALQESGAGSALDNSEQTLFRPGAAPRSMTIATGIVDDDLVKSLVMHVRQSEHGRTFHQAMWQRLMADHPKAYQHIGRSAGRGELARLLVVETEGLPDSVRAIGRTIVKQALVQLPTSKLVKGVVRWDRRVDERGIEVLEPPTGIEALGPTGRAAGPAALHLGTEAFSACVESLHLPSGEVVGLATKIGDSDALLLTASAVLQEHPDASVLGVPETGFDPLPLGLSCLKGRRGSGLQLAGLTQLRPGRVVIVGHIETGEIAVRHGTICSISADGGFHLDVRAALGSPVVDSETGTVLGVVTRVDPTIALGPQPLQPLLLLGGAATSSSFDDELDTGLQIPRDVLALGIGGPEDHTSVAPDLAASWSTLPLNEFVQPILRPATDFHPLLFREGRLDDVDVDVPPPSPDDVANVSEFILDDKRVLLQFHRIQVSGQVPFATFDFLRTADDLIEDHQMDVTNIVGRGLE